MSQNKVNLMAVGVVVVSILGAENAYGQEVGFFEGCGKLRMTAGPEQCLAFFPDSGEYSRGLLHAFPDFQEGDRVYASGLIIACGSFCSIHGCLEADSTIAVCTTPPIPTTSTWGLAALGLLVLGSGAIVLTRRGYRRTPPLVCALLLVAVAGTTSAQEVSVEQRVNRMLERPHHSQRIFVRFKGGRSQAERKALHEDAGTVKIKTYRFVDGLTAVEVLNGDLDGALTRYLGDEDVLYAEPDYLGRALAVPNDTDFGLLWGMQNTGQAVNNDPGTAGADIRAASVADSFRAVLTLRRGSFRLCGQFYR